MRESDIYIPVKEYTYDQKWNKYQIDSCMFDYLRQDQIYQIQEMTYAVKIYTINHLIFLVYRGSLTKN